MRTGTIFSGLLLLALSWSAGAQFTDDFTDGDFTDDPRWEGDSLHFEVNGDRQLHLRWTGSGTSVLATPNALTEETEWNFWVKLSFNTSVNNYLKVYLAADRNELDMPLNGYFLQVGGESDSLVVYRQEGIVLTPLFHFPDGSTGQSVNSLRVRITRDTGGSWQGSLDPEGGTNYLPQGSWADNTIQQATWFGFWCRYTSSNASRFYMDDLYAGPVIRDTVAPALTSLAVSDTIHLLLTFTEALEEEAGLDLANYMLTGTQVHPSGIRIPAGRPDQTELTFADPFQTGKTDTLSITNLVDLSENRMADTLVPFAFYTPGGYDILINEIMFDPEPSAGLPPEEYVELYNRTACPVNLAGWCFDAGSVRKILPQVMIQGHGFLLLTRESSTAFFGPTVPLFTSGSTLPNEGCTLVLRNEALQVIHAVSYAQNWISEPWKRDGGWSLEIADPENPCGCDENWKASTDPGGGTPGQVNSAGGFNPDLVSPGILRSYLADTGTWVLHFTEAIDTTTLGVPSAWSMEPGGKRPVAMIPVAPHYSKARLIFSGSFEPGIIYTLSGSYEIKDCAGNPVELPALTRAGIPASAGFGDIIINEVLHDPFPGGSRFIELFNRSEILADLHDLALVVPDEGPDAGMTAVTPLTGEPYLVFPLDFVVLCSTRRGVSNYYRIPYPDRFLEMDPFPSMENDSGSVSLVRSCNETLIDRMTYSQWMHFPLLSSVQGVSLERISPEQPSGILSNWHSAAENAGYATPGYENSQWFRPDAGDDEVTVNPGIFSPDNDGHNDVTSVGVATDKAGYQVTVLIYDASGRMVRRLASNTLAGCNDAFTWDGTRDDLTISSTGIYVIFLEMVHPDGTVKRFRKSVVVAGVL